MNTHTIHEQVKEKYAAEAKRARERKTGCCGEESHQKERDPITSCLYGENETSWLPEQAISASLGCGNPSLLAKLNPGETVLDLGSGGGIDVLLSAKRVGPLGKAYGLDMTDEMLALAHENLKKSGLGNVEFLKGEIETIPLPDSSVDVIISNCVINLSADKGQVLKEAFRVLKPGGRLAISDIVARGDMPQAIRNSLEAWAGCVAGALTEDEYVSKLKKAGFSEISIEPTRIYRSKDAEEFLASSGLDVEKIASEADGKWMSAFVRAVKPKPVKRTEA